MLWFLNKLNNLVFKTIKHNKYINKQQNKKKKYQNKCFCSLCRNHKIVLKKKSLYYFMFKENRVTNHKTKFHKNKQQSIVKIKHPCFI